MAVLRQRTTVSSSGCGSSAGLAAAQLTGGDFLWLWPYGADSASVSLMPYVVAGMLPFALLVLGCSRLLAVAGL